MSQRKNQPSPYRKIEFFGGPADGDVRTFTDPPVSYHVPHECVQSPCQRSSDAIPEEVTASMVVSIYIFDSKRGGYVWRGSEQR